MERQARRAVLAIMLSSVRDGLELRRSGLGMPSSFLGKDRQRLRSGGVVRLPLLLRLPADRDVLDVLCGGRVGVLQLFFDKPFEASGIMRLVAQHLEAPQHPL